jgi:glycosyltransferase involved in cell wall biosynthesis
MKISVIIPLYNKVNSIANCLNSVFQQSYKPFEIIVVNDGSIDGSAQIVSGMKNSLVKLINQPNMGVSSARNRGILEANGDWIAFLDADDIWLPDYLSTISYLFEQYPEANVLATSYYLQDHNGIRKNIILNKIDFSGSYGILNNYFEVASCSHPPICSSAVVIKRSLLDFVGGFPSDIMAGEDLITWAKLAANNLIAFSIIPFSVFIQAPAHTYNDKPNRIPQVPDKVGKELMELAKMNKGVVGIRKYVSLWFKMRASIFLRLGRKPAAFIEICKSLAYNPLNGKSVLYLFLVPFPVRFINRIFKKFGN